MATIIGCTEGHNEAQRMPYGKASASYPECVMAECDCEERQVLRASEAVCRCRSHGPGPEGPHPWDEEYGEWSKSGTNTCGWSITAG